MHGMNNLQMTPLKLEIINTGLFTTNYFTTFFFYENSPQYTAILQTHSLQNCFHNAVLCTEFLRHELDISHILTTKCNHPCRLNDIHPTHNETETAC